MFLVRGIGLLDYWRQSGCNNGLAVEASAIVQMVDGFITHTLSKSVRAVGGILKLRTLSASDVVR